MTTVGAEPGELAAERVACRRGDRPIFSELSCVVPAGGALVLTGANGSGKSSLLRLLATLLRPADGRLLWDGRPVTNDLGSYRSRLHYLGHLDGIKPALSVRETLEYGARVRGTELPQIDRALAAFALERLADWPCRWLSAGQRRRLALARLIAAPAPLWLLDEPTSALDSDGERRLLAAIAAQREGGGGVVVATHQPLPLDGAESLALEDFESAPDDPLTDF